MPLIGRDDMGLTEDPPTKNGSALQALPLGGGEGTQSLPINAYLTKDGNQIGSLEKAVPCTSWFTLQIRCQRCALWLVTGGVAWISKSLLPGEREQGDTMKNKQTKTAVELSERSRTVYYKKKKMLQDNITLHYPLKILTLKRNNRQWQAEAIRLRKRAERTETI